MTAQVGDVITTAEELDALPDWSAVMDAQGDVAQRLPDYGRWLYPGVPTPARHSDVAWHGSPLTVIALPGQPPRPERVVKAEALREAAEAEFFNGDTDHARPGYYLLCARAARIEADR